MPRATTRAARPAAGRAPPAWMAIAVPVSTGATDAASVAGRTADHQTRAALRRGTAATAMRLRPLGELGEVGLSLLHVCVAPFLRLFAQVVEERRIARELLDAGQAVVGGVETRLEKAQCQWAQLQHAPAPRDRLALEVGQRHDLVDQAHVQRLLGVVLLAEKPDLTRLLLADDARQQPRAIAAVEAADARARLAEASVVGGDGEVAHHVQHVAAADRVAGDHRDHRLGQAPDLDLDVEDVQAADALGVDVAVVASDALVAPRAERLGARASEDDHADGRVVARRLEGPAHLDHGQRPEGVADLGPVYRDLGDALPGLVQDVLVVARPRPRRGLILQVITPRAITSSNATGYPQPSVSPDCPALGSTRTSDSPDYPRVGAAAPLRAGYACWRGFLRGKSRTILA